MFYCKECKEQNNWPESYNKSFGACEMCGEVKPSPRDKAKKNEDQ